MFTSFTQKEIALISICEMSSRTSSSLKTEAIRCLEMSVTSSSCRSETFRKNKVLLWVCAVLGLSDLLRKRSFLQSHTHTRPCCPNTEALVVHSQSIEDELRRTGSRCNLASLLTSYRVFVLFFAKVCFRQIN